MPSVTDPQSLNRYSYARNNPVLYTDPSGHFFKKAFRSSTKWLDNQLSPIEGFAWKYRHYASAGHSIGFDYALNSNPYVRMAIGIGGTTAADPWGWAASAGFGAYTTRLDGGSSLDALRSGVIAGAASGAGSVVGNYVGGAVGGGTTGNVVGAAASGATSGAISSTLNGSDPGQGALYGAAFAASFATIQVAAVQLSEYYATKDKLGREQLNVDQKDKQNLQTRGARPRPRERLAEAFSDVPELLNQVFGFGAARLKYSEVNAKFYELEGLVPYGESGQANVWVNINKSSPNFGEVGGTLGQNNIYDPCSGQVFMDTGLGDCQRCSCISGVTYSL